MIGEMAVREKDFPSLKGGSLRRKSGFLGKERVGRKARDRVKEREEK